MNSWDDKIGPLSNLLEDWDGGWDDKIGPLSNLLEDWDGGWDDIGPLSGDFYDLDYTNDLDEDMAW